MNRAVIVGEELPSKYVVFDKTNQKTVKYSKRFLKKLFELNLIDVENSSKLYETHL